MRGLTFWGVRRLISKAWPIGEEGSSRDRQRVSSLGSRVYWCGIPCSTEDALSGAEPAARASSVLWEVAGSQAGLEGCLKGEGRALLLPQLSCGWE